MSLDTALAFARRGWSPLPIPDRQKRPAIKGWQNLRISEADLGRYFNKPQNVGVLLGEPSGGLVDVDLDCAEAIRLAPRLLPPTGARFGRRSKPGSHHLYIARHARTEQYREPTSDGTGAMLVELRSTGAQTVFPGSVHESGERVVFEADGDPADVAGATLARRVRHLAAAALLARHGFCDDDAVALVDAWEPGADDGLPDHVAAQVREWLGLASASRRSVERQPHRAEHEHLIRRARAYVDRMPSAVSGQNGHGATYAAALALVRGFALDDGDALAILRDYSVRCDPPWSERELEHKIHSARETKAPDAPPFGYLRDEEPPRQREREPAAAPSGAAPPSSAAPAERPEIRISTEITEVADEAIAALAADENVYQRGGRLSRVVVTDSPLRRLKMQEPAPRIEVLPHASLVELLAARAVWLRHDKRSDEWVRTFPPDVVVKAVEARGRWEGVRHLEAIVDSPVLRPDGSVLDIPGYDATTGLLYRPNAAFLAVAERPSLEDAQRARDELYEVVADFQFAGHAHRAAWLAALLTHFARYAYSGPTPLFLGDSNVRGAGKGLLVDTIAITATGRCAPVTPLPPDDAEMSKTISSVLLAGLPMLVFDNVGADLGSPALDLLLTSRTYSARVLGKSEMSGELPAYTLLFATGNNVQIKADTARRILWMRLESTHERPEDRRDFRHPDLRAWLAHERPRLVCAALTILRAYCVAGRPRLELRPWGSFEAWSDLVRGAVAWLGEPDPGDTRIELAEEADTEAHGLLRLVESLEVANLGDGFTASAVIQRAYSFDGGGRQDPISSALREAVEELCPTNGARQPSSKSLGRRLRHLRRRIVAGRMLDTKGESAHAIVWCVRRASAIA
jgi:hypothetical protein